jgi:hypothetical protein
MSFVFQSVLLMSKLFLNNGYKAFKILIHIFNHHIDSKKLWYVHNVCTITFYKKELLLLLFKKFKTQKIKQWLRLLMAHVNMIAP